MGQKEANYIKTFLSSSNPLLFESSVIRNVFLLFSSLCLVPSTLASLTISMLIYFSHQTSFMLLLAAGCSPALAPSPLSHASDELRRRFSSHALQLGEGQRWGLDGRGSEEQWVTGQGKGWDTSPGPEVLIQASAKAAYAELLQPTVPSG